MEPTRGGDPASVRVLTDRALFAHITSFMDGLPFRIAMFVKAERFRPRLEGRYPSLRGLLPQLAIIVDDEAMLSAIQRFADERRRLQREQSARLAAAPADPKQAAMDRELEFHAVVRCAVRFDRLHLLEWLQQHLSLDAYEFEHGLMDIAVTHTRGTAVMDWVLAQALGRMAGARADLRQVSPWALRVVAYRGQLDKLRWLHAHGFKGFSPAIADAAASTGQLETLRFLHDEGVASCTPRAMFLSATNGHLEVVRYLHANRGRDGALAARASQGMTRAALHGYHDVVAFLGQSGYEPMWGTLQDVVAAGRLEALRALCLFSTEGCLFDARRSAKRRHNAEMVELLSSLIAHNVWFCSQRKHSPLGPRRCQKPLERLSAAGEGGGDKSDS